MSTAGYLLLDTGYELSLHLVHPPFFFVFNLCTSTNSYTVIFVFLSPKPFYFCCQSICLLLWEATLLTLFLLSPVCQFCSNLLCVADRQKCQPCLGLRALCHQFNSAVQVQYTWTVQLLLMKQNPPLQRAGN